MPLDLIAVGDVMLDGALPAPVAGGRVHGRIELRAGGSAANAALAAARLGARAAVIGRVGVDAAGRLVADTLAAAGVEPLLARDPEARTGCVVVIGGTSVVADPGRERPSCAGRSPGDPRGARRPGLGLLAPSGGAGGRCAGGARARAHGLARRRRGVGAPRRGIRRRSVP